MVVLGVDYDYGVLNEGNVAELAAAQAAVSASLGLQVALMLPLVPGERLVDLVGEVDISYGFNMRSTDNMHVTANALKRLATMEDNSVYRIYWKQSVGWMVEPMDRNAVCFEQVQTALKSCESNLVIPTAGFVLCGQIADRSSFAAKALHLMTAATVMLRHKGTVSVPFLSFIGTRSELEAAMDDCSRQYWDKYKMLETAIMAMCPKGFCLFVTSKYNGVPVGPADFKKCFDGNLASVQLAFQPYMSFAKYYEREPHPALISPPAAGQMIPRIPAAGGNLHRGSRGAAALAAGPKGRQGPAITHAPPPAALTSARPLPVDDAAVPMMVEHFFANRSVPSSSWSVERFFVQRAEARCKDQAASRDASASASVHGDWIIDSLSVD
jgi:hypothetical protein